MIQKELQELCKRLKDNDPTLRELNLSYFNIGIDGARALRDALKHNRHVFSIRLYHSNLGFKGTTILFEGLRGRGIKTTVNIVDDYNDAEYDQLLMMVKQPPKEKKGAFGNKKGIDDQIFANLENHGRGHVVQNTSTNKDTNKEANKGDQKAEKSADQGEKAAVASYAAESKQNG